MKEKRGQSHGNTLHSGTDLLVFARVGGAVLVQRSFEREGETFVQRQRKNMTANIYVNDKRTRKVENRGADGTC